MNREERRNFTKRMRKNGMPKGNAEKFVKIVDAVDRYTPRKEIHTGDRVTLNVSALKGKKNYGIMNPEYRNFVEKSDGVVYTAVCEREELIHMEEQPRWLFWCGDMDVVEPANNEPAKVQSEEA